MMEKVFQYLNDLLYDTDGAQWSDLCDEFLLYGVPPYSPSWPAASPYGLSYSYASGSYGSRSADGMA